MRSAGIHRGKRRVFLRKAVVEFPGSPGKTSALLETEDGDGLRDGDFLRGGIAFKPKGGAVRKHEEDAVHAEGGALVLGRTK